jgi:hypothetical protein
MHAGSEERNINKLHVHAARIFRGSKSNNNNNNKKFVVAIMIMMMPREDTSKTRRRSTSLTLVETRNSAPEAY